jgi:Tfp pilus assembly protein PilO
MSNVPTKEQLTATITQMIIQRAQMKDNIEQIERQLPVLQGQLQLLNSIAAQEVVTD